MIVGFVCFAFGFALGIALTVPGFLPQPAGITCLGCGAAYPGEGDWRCACGRGSITVGSR